MCSPEQAKLEKRKLNAGWDRLGILRPRWLRRISRLARRPNGLKAQNDLDCPRWTKLKTAIFDSPDPDWIKELAQDVDTQEIDIKCDQ